MSYYGTYNGTGYNVTYVQDSQAGYAALTCSEVRMFDLKAVPENPHPQPASAARKSASWTYLRLQGWLCAHALLLHVGEAAGMARHCRH